MFNYFSKRAGLSTVSTGDQNDTKKAPHGHPYGARFGGPYSLIWADPVPAGVGDMDRSGNTCAASPLPPGTDVLPFQAPMLRQMDTTASSRLSPTGRSMRTGPWPKSRTRRYLWPCRPRRTAPDAPYTTAPSWPRVPLRCHGSLGSVRLASCGRLSRSSRRRCRPWRCRCLLVSWQSSTNTDVSAVSPSVTTEDITLPPGEVRTWCLQVSATHLFPAEPRKSCRGWPFRPRSCLHASGWPCARRRCCQRLYRLNLWWDESTE